MPELYVISPQGKVIQKDFGLMVDLLGTLLSAMNDLDVMLMVSLMRLMDELKDSLMSGTLITTGIPLRTLLM